MTVEETGFFKGEGGVVWEMTLPLPETQAEKVTKGYLVRVNADGSPYVDPEAQENPEPDALAPLPDAKAPKPLWIGWVVKHCGVTPDDAEAMTRHDLIDKAKARMAQAHAEGAA